MSSQASPDAFRSPPPVPRLNFHLRKSYDASSDRSSTLISAYNPDSDLKALMERYRTGPFRPKANLFESVSHEEGDSVSGIDLRKWAEGGWSSDEVRKDSLPPVLTTLLDALNTKYGEITNDFGQFQVLICVTKRFTVILF